MFPKSVNPNNKQIHVVMFQKSYVTLQYAFQPQDSFQFDGDGVVEGRVVLYPMEGGSYRPPARAHFDFAANRRVGSGGILESSIPGIVIDQQHGKLYFGGSDGRFDHCTDLGRIDFDALKKVDADLLERKREDTEILEGHTYLYESNIYDPGSRTKHTGLDVRYAKIFVESINAADVPTDLILAPNPALAGERLQISYRPGSEDLHGASSVNAYWNAYDSENKSLLNASDAASQHEFPSESRGTQSGDFTLGRKRCRIDKMTPMDDGFWKCALDVPSQARSLAIVFVDELDRTSSKGIQVFPVEGSSAK
jgi:hypothetical protein